MLLLGSGIIAAVLQLSLGCQRIGCVMYEVSLEHDQQHLGL
jgi:hypothetical protein